MNKIIKLISISTIVVLTGCNSMGGYTPTIDPAGEAQPRGYYPQYTQPRQQQNGPNYNRSYEQQGNVQQDIAECEQLAKRSANVVGETVKGAGVGALIGAAGGAIVGAFTGNPGTGAGIGAAAGGFGGATYKGLSSDQRYKQAFDNCMANRGHRVVR